MVPLFFFFSFFFYYFPTVGSPLLPSLNTWSLFPASGLLPLLFPLSGRLCRGVLADLLKEPFLYDPFSPQEQSSRFYKQYLKSF